MSYTKEELQEMLKNSQISSDALESLLKAREKGEVHFNLVDIREVFEYTDSAIAGTDLLVPTSMIQQHLDKLDAIKEDPIILYCRTGNRTGQIMQALTQQLGYQKVSHLSSGIVSYHGEKLRDAVLPNDL